jgi:hypothetical protein
MAKVSVCNCRICVKRDGSMKVITIKIKRPVKRAKEIANGNVR